jgi:hypothetical protein
MVYVISCDEVAAFTNWFENTKLPIINPVGLHSLFPWDLILTSADRNLACNHLGHDINTEPNYKDSFCVEVGKKHASESSFPATIFLSTTRGV